MSKLKFGGFDRGRWWKGISGRPISSYKRVFQAFKFGIFLMALSIFRDSELGKEGYVEVTERGYKSDWWGRYWFWKRSSVRSWKVYKIESRRSTVGLFSEGVCCRFLLERARITIVIWKTGLFCFSVWAVSFLRQFGQKSRGVKLSPISAILIAFQVV